MLQKSTLDITLAGSLQGLVLDYLKKKSELRPFYSVFPDMEGFKEALDKNPYASLNRDLLKEELIQQHQRVSNTSAETISNISKLGESNCYTITTGHQLCLFTGPLYFVTKIISAIRLSQQLNEQFPERQFVPVYWMASEDHDFDEINHCVVYGKTVRWESKQTGAVGEFTTEGLKEVLDAMKDVLGPSPQAGELMSLFEASYLNHQSLSDATRYMVNALFGRYGLVVVDGNNKSFKSICTSLFKKDLFTQSIHQQVSTQINSLKALGYEAQVNPRAINLFYLNNGVRARIEKDGDAFQVVGHSIRFTEGELTALLEQEPQRFSPNVVLRPIYQQLLLPNLAYVGGPGEIAYWLEFKSAFDANAVYFPLLIPRDFNTIVDKGLQNKLSKLGFDLPEVFKAEATLVQEFQARHNRVFEAADVKTKLETLYTELGESILTVDKSLKGSVSAEMQKALGGIEALVAKANKALKLQSEQEINQIKSIKQKLFPDQVPVERVENFSSYYLRYGSSFMEALISGSDPLVFDQKLYLEQ